MAKVKWLKHLLTKRRLSELYIERKLSMAEIARQLDVTYQTIIYWLKKFNIDIRGPKTYEKSCFSGDNPEKFYLSGLSLGDFNVGRHNALIRVRTSTTHPSMISLFRLLFEKYSFVNQIRINSGMTPSWYLYTHLDSSFDFLLKRSFCLRSLTSEEFYSFLSGYTDAEGCLCITKNTGGGMRYHFSLASEDIEVLAQIEDYLIKLGYKTSFRLSVPKGNVTSNGKRYNKDYWDLSIYSKRDVLKLIGNLNVKHYEKVRWKELMIKLGECKKWLDVEEKVLELRGDIRAEVLKCIE
jgi:hypothetical protein